MNSLFLSPSSSSSYTSLFSPSRSSTRSQRQLLSPLHKTPTISSIYANVKHSSNIHAPRRLPAESPSPPSSSSLGFSRRFFASPSNSRLDALVAAAFGPNKFTAPTLDDDEDDDTQIMSDERYGTYRDRTSSDTDQEEAKEAENKYDDAQDDHIHDPKNVDDTNVDWVDLSSLLLQLRMSGDNPQQNQLQKQPASEPNTELQSLQSALQVTRSALSSAALPSPSPLTSSPLETSIALTLQELQQQYHTEAQGEVDDKIAALEQALADAFDEEQSNESSAPYLAVVQSSLQQQNRQPRSQISTLVEDWQKYHTSLHDQYQQHLQQYLVEQKKEQDRQTKLEQERLRQQKEQQEREEAEAAARKAADELKEKQEEEKRRKKAAAEERKQKDAADNLQQKQAAQSSQVTSAVVSSPPVPASSFTPYEVEYSSIHSLASSFSGSNKLDHKMKINRAITQISQTTSSVQNKTMLLLSLALQAQQTGQAEYAYVIETMAEKLVVSAAKPDNRHGDRVISNLI